MTQTVEQTDSHHIDLVFANNLVSQEVLSLRSPWFSVLLHHLLHSIRGLKPWEGLVFQVSKTVELVTSSSNVTFYLAMIATAGVSVYFNNNLFVPIHLLEVVVCSLTLRQILSSICQRKHVFGLIFALILVLVLIFAVYAFFFIPENVQVELEHGRPSENGCNTAAHCFLVAVTYVGSNESGISF